MKIKKLIIGLSVLGSLSLGVAGVVSATLSKKEPVKAEAATNSVTLAGSFNSWSTTANPLTLNGDYWTIEKTLAVNDTFKIVVNGSDWIGDGDGVTWCSGMGSEGKGNNFKVLTAGTYIIKAAKTIGDYGDKSHGIVFENVVKYTVTKYKVLDGGSPISIESEQVNAGTNYGVPANRYEAGYSFEGWYTTSACTTKYTAKAINANTGIYAKYTSGTWSGTLHVDLNNSGWANDAANYAILFMDKTTYPSEVVGWSSYVTGAVAGHRLVEVPYSLQFEPKLMTVVRYDTSKTQSDWNTDKWNSVWSQTKDVDFSQTIRIGNTTDSGDNNKHYAYGGFPKLIGGVGGAWNDIAYLESVKENGSNNAEFYKLDVTLAANTAFKVLVGPYNDGDYYATYTPHSSISSRFSGGGSNNIVCSTAGTYAFYFDSYAHTLYITREEIAEADEWAQYFNAHVGCDPTGQSTPSGWSSCATEYAKLSDDAKDYVYGETANPSGTYTQVALVTYDYAVAHHASLTKFVTNHSGTPRNVAPVTSPAALVGNVVNNNNVIAIVVIISVVAVPSIGAYFFVFKKRKQD